MQPIIKPKLKLDQMVNAAIPTLLSRLPLLPLGRPWPPPAPVKTQMLQSKIENVYIFNAEYIWFLIYLYISINDKKKAYIMYQSWKKHMLAKGKIFTLVDEQKLLKMELQSIGGINGGDGVRGLPLCYEGLELKEEESTAVKVPLSSD